MTAESSPLIIHPPFVSGLRCLRCGRSYAYGEIEYTCPCRPNRGSDVGSLDVLYDYAEVRRQIDPATLVGERTDSIARYWPLLPIASHASLPPTAVGGTPFYHAWRLGNSMGLTRLFVKDDGRNPSASFKDRASAIAVARAREAGASVIATASTGNAAAALATLCASVGQPNVIFVPKSAPPAKIAQLLIHGSVVLAVEGSYDQAFDLCMEACAEFGWYNRNTGYNPFMTEGKKTVSYEIAEQLAAGAGGATPFRAPDAIFVSVGDGCIIGGVHKGFRDLFALGWIEQIPRLYGVQSTKSAALYHAWRAGREIPEPVHAATRADSISVDAPRDPLKALAAVRQTGGAFIAVEDDEILQAMPRLAQQAGVFAEPAGAAALAGALQALHDGLIQRDETVVIINTGSGLKDVPAAIQATGGVTIIEPTLDAVRRMLQNSSLLAERL